MVTQPMAQIQGREVEAERRLFPFNSYAENGPFIPKNGNSRGSRAQSRRVRATRFAGSDILHLPSPCLLRVGDSYQRPPDPSALHPPWLCFLLIVAATRFQEEPCKLAIPDREPRYGGRKLGCAIRFAFPRPVRYGATWLMRGLAPQSVTRPSECTLFPSAYLPCAPRHLTD